MNPGRRLLFHTIGIVIVIFWVLLLVHLYRNIHTTKDSRSINIAAPRTDWFEILFKNKKIGYLTDRLLPQKKGYIVKEDLAIKVAFLGYLEDVNMSLRCDTDKAFLLKRFDLTLFADRIRFHISGMVRGNKLIINRILGGKRVQYKIYLTKPPILGISMFPFISSKRITVGEVISVPFLDPTTMSQHEIKIRVVDKERIRIKDITYKAYRLETEIWGSPVVIWVNSDGSVLKQKGLMNLILVRSNPQDAMANMEGPEIYNVISIKANKEIPDPRSLSYLKVKIDGGGYHDKVMEIKRAVLPEGTFYEIPYSKKDLSIYLRPEFNIECDSPIIKQKAKEIAGAEKDPIRIVKKVLDWVYRNIEKKPVLSFPSAVETLKSRIGDCNEHAVLVAALLRAVGIPSRIRIGLIYDRGRFFYHAWNEAYVGKWVPIDATLDQMPVDSAHVPLFYGNVDKQVQITRFLGNLKIKILGFSHDKANRAHKEI